MTSRRTDLPPPLEVDGTDYEVPHTETTHAQIVGTATRRGVDASILVPTLRPDYLEYHALTALLNSPKDTSVMVMSANAGVRRRYKDLGLRNGHLVYSETFWPLASVKAEGDLAQKTELYINHDGYPQFLFAKYSTRLPRGKDADRVHTVLYDDTVTFDWGRWTEFTDWRDEHDIASVVYFCRDPTGPVADQILDVVDTTWAWTPSALGDTVDADQQGRVDTSAASDGGGTIPESTLRDHELIQQRARGVTYDLQILPSGDIAEALTSAWSYYESLIETAREIGADDAISAAKGYERAINGYSRLIADPEYSRNYRVGHGRAKPHDVRIGQLEAVADGLSGDAGALSPSLRKAVRRLEDVQETLNDESNLGDWKRGSVLRAIQSIVDDSDQTLHVVAADEPARKAVRADLQLNRGNLWGRAKSLVDIHSPATLTQAPIADELILYGPPRRGDLWVLRTPNADRVTILAYPHELGLLHYQVRSLNDAIVEFTPTRPTDSDATDGSEPRPNSALDDSVLSLVDGLEDDRSGTDDEETSLTHQAGPYEGISVDIPDPEEVAEFSDPEVISVDEAEETDSPVDRYKIVSEDTDTSLDDLVRDTVDDHRSTIESAGSGGGSGGVPPVGGGGGGRAGRVSTRRVGGLVEVRTDDGYAYAGNPTDTVEVVRMAERTTVEKRLEDVKSGERVVLVRDYQAVRQAVEDHLMTMGEIDIVVRAHMWHQQLDIELEDSGDSVQDFIEKVKAAGATATSDSTFERWYTGAVNMPRSKVNLQAIVDAFGMDEIDEHFQDVWDANWKIRKIKREVVKHLKWQAADALIDHDPNEDVVLHEDLDVRLSDFDPTDQEGRPLVEQHTIEQIAENVERPVSYVGRWRHIDG